MNDQQPGITFTSLMAGLFAMLLMAMMIQFADVVLGYPFTSEHTLALEALWVILLLVLVVAAGFALTRVRLLSRAELLCVLYALLIGAPLMTQGFWHRVVAVIATIPRSNDFDKMDAFPDNLWPHGPNLVNEAFDRGHAATLRFQGSHDWQTTDYESKRRAEVPLLQNTEPNQTSSVQIRLPIEKDGKPFLIGNEPYVISVLLRPKDLGVKARYYCRAAADGQPNYQDVFSSDEPAKLTYLHQTGFRRVGSYGVKFPGTVQRYVDLEFGLEGQGRLELWDPKVLSVGALEGVYKGRLIVSESQYRELPAGERAGVIIRPDHWGSLAGLKFVVAGYIPWRDWAAPLLAWSSFILLVLLACLAVAVIIRRQWLDNERFVMPVTRVPVALLGDEEDPAHALPPIWRNKIAWLGFAVALIWVLLCAFASYNPKAPNLTISIPLKSYFSGPGWGTTFDGVRFDINAIFLAMCCFMELNVLMSLVVGYWLFRAQGWVGASTGWNNNPNYPFTVQQSLAGYVTYGLLVLVFARKYLWRIVQSALGRVSESADGEALSYRTALALLAAVFAGGALWAGWLGIGVGGLLLFLALLVLIGFVAMKVRTECGAPWGYFTPYSLAVFMTALGGIATFGPTAMLFCWIASFFLAPTVFFLIPGAQLELIELGRRWRVIPRHLVITVVLGLLGGLVIGGWVFLSNGYALGGESLRYSWAFDTKFWYFFPYNTEMNETTSAWLSGTAAKTGTWFTPHFWAYAYGAAGTALVTVLRQLFAGFWFHPVGFILASTGCLNYIWGSALTAWVIRRVVLWMGGAATIRNKLQPFFVGVLLGAVVAELLLCAHAQHLHSLGIERFFGVLSPP